MAKKKAAKSPRAPKVKAPKVEVITHFAHTARESKALSNRENTSQLAQVYRTVGEAGPADFDTIYKTVRDTMNKAPRGGELEKRQTNVRTYLSRLVKSGLVKRLNVKGDPLPEVTRKPRAAKPKAAKPAKTKKSYKKREPKLPVASDEELNLPVEDSCEPEVARAALNPTEP